MKVIKILVFTAISLGVMTLPSFADTVTETTTTVTTIRTDAPIYMGPVQDVELMELTLSDFQFIATKPSSAFQLYNDYQREIGESSPNPTLVPYKMKITDRTLVLADFQGTDVSQELAQARYNAYLQTNPTPIDGQSIRYVYVYHTPIARLAKN